MLNDNSVSPSVYIGDNPHVRRLSITYTHVPETPITNIEWFVAPSIFTNLQRLQFGVMIDARDYRHATAIVKLVKYIPEVILDITELPETSCLEIGSPEYERKVAFVSKTCQPFSASPPYPNLKRVRIMTSDLTFAQHHLQLKIKTCSERYTEPELLSNEHLQRLELDVNGGTLICKQHTPEANADFPQYVRCRATYAFTERFRIVFDHNNVKVNTISFNPKDLKDLSMNPLISIYSPWIYCLLSNVSGVWKARPRY